MHEPGLISAYADLLARELSFDRSLARCVREEVEQHLLEAAAAEPTADSRDAQRNAIAKFGDPCVIAAQFVAVSLASRARKLAAIAALTIGGAYALMKARLAWYAAVQLAISDELRATGSVVLRIDGFSFWLAVAIAIGACAYIASRRIPAQLNHACRKKLRRFFLLCAASAAALFTSAISDAILTGFRVAGTDWSPGLLFPMALMAIEIAGVGALSIAIGREALRARSVAMRLMA